MPSGHFRDAKGNIEQIGAKVKCGCIYCPGTYYLGTEGFGHSFPTCQQFRDMDPWEYMRSITQHYAALSRGN